ncbi:MAG: hypothetical protein ABW022_11110 [Actinoplanes sp.]
MALLDIGSLGFQIGALGILLFTFLFLVAVRWWTDWLGRVFGGVLFATSAVLAMTAYRQINPEHGEIVFIVRAIIFWLFGIAVWSSLVTFVWAQFFAPRSRGSRLVRKRTTPKEEKV